MVELASDLRSQPLIWTHTTLYDKTVIGKLSSDLASQPLILSELTPFSMIKLYQSKTPVTFADHSTPELQKLF